MKKSQILFLIVTLLITISVNSLNAQAKNSIYSIFGVGQVIDDSYGINKSLGGTGIAFQSGRTINYLNPASYIGIAPNSVVMESGIYGIYNTSKSDNTSQSDSDLNFSYFSTSFYLSEWWAFSFGIVPFSSINYEINSVDDVEGELTSFEKKIKGSGGLKRIYFGNSFNPFDRLTVGFNTSFIFGSITQVETALDSDNFDGYELKTERDAYSFYLDYGMQYSYSYNDWLYSIGLTYGASQTLNSKDQSQITHVGGITTLEYDEKSAVEIPQKFGIGIAANRGPNLRIGFDYQWKNWADLNFSNINFEAKNSNRFSVGAEYSPGNREKFYNRFFYRFGANYKTSYLEIDNTPINSFGINLGFGIPYDNSSIFNLSFEYGEEGTTAKGLIKNSYAILYFNFSLHEFLAIIDPQK